VIAHWDEIEGRLLETGPMRLTRIDLGVAIDSDRIGVGLLKLQPGGRSSPVHCELAEEEIFFGRGLGSGSSSSPAAASRSHGCGPVEASIVAAIRTTPALGR
jgi:hypothetical protein